VADTFFHRRAGVPIGLAFRNGFATVSADGIAFREHSSKHRARFAYSFDYEPVAPAPRGLLEFLSAVFRDDEDAVEKTLLVQEYFGGALVGVSTDYPACLVAIGDGGDGKSTLGNIMASAFPPGAICSVAPQDMAQEYRRAELAGKRLNIVAELPEADIVSAGAFKAVIAGDRITARPIREAPFSFQPEAGHYMSANRLPGTNDHSVGFWRRWLVLPFNRSFVNDTTRDPAIARKLTRAELPAIAHWLMAGAVRLLRQNGHTQPDSHVRSLAKWRTNADQVALFIETACRPSASDRPGVGSDWTKAATLYKRYREWSTENGHRPMASNSFGERLRIRGLRIVHMNGGNHYPLADALGPLG
jgi:putative DNA primase/helicase